MLGDYIPTVFDSCNVNITVDGRDVELGLFDTSPNDQLRVLAYPQTDVFLICFSIVYPPSFENVSKIWYPEIRHYAPNTPFLLVGLKEDLKADQETIAKLRDRRMAPITFEEGSALAKHIGASQYIECSALTTKGLLFVFDQAVKTVGGAPLKQKKGICQLL